MSGTVLAVDQLLGRVADAPVKTHSRRVGPGDVFVSLPKAVPCGADGPDYAGTEAHIVQAVQAGAALVICRREEWDAARPSLTLAPEVCLVDDTRAALGRIASARHGTDPAAPRLLAVTGTNGKTTTAYLLEAVVRAAGLVPGVIGTVEYRWPGHRQPSPLTTPDTLTLHAMVAAMADAGTDTALMEVSSHAVDQDRIAGLRFSGALFTNLTQDHLDYHRDMEDYFAVKARLFRPGGPYLVPGAALAANIDDPYGRKIFEANPEVLGYGLRQPAERVLAGEILGQGPDGLRLRMRWQDEQWVLASPLVGEFNASNLLGAQAMAVALGLPRTAIQALADFNGVPGRLERIVNPQGLNVFVDYAHTPDALVKAINALRGAGFKRILTVFGCGGDRDRTKRPLMGEAAASLADVVILTSDNPRTEDPLAIMADVRPGLAAARQVIEEADRRKAITLALDAARPGDALLIAGKGHEGYQIIGRTRLPFSDQQVVREVLGCA